MVLEGLLECVKNPDIKKEKKQKNFSILKKKQNTIKILDETKNGNKLRRNGNT